MLLSLVTKPFVIFPFLTVFPYPESFLSSFVSMVFRFSLGEKNKNKLPIMNEKKTTVRNDNNLEKVGIFWRKKKLTMSIQKKTSHPEEIDEKWTGNRKKSKGNNWKSFVPPMNDLKFPGLRKLLHKKSSNAQEMHFVFFFFLRTCLLIH